MNKEISFYVNFYIKPEYTEVWLKAATHVLESMSAEDSFISAYLHKDINDSTRFTLYERWNEPSMEAFIKNQLQGKDYRDEYEKLLPEWSKCPRTFSQLEPLMEWNKKINTKNI